MRGKSIGLYLIILFLYPSCDKARKSVEFVFNRYRISSPSMSPTLNVGETYAAFSANQFQLNQIVIFYPPSEHQGGERKIVYCFRLVGLPGDVLMMKKSILYLNGREYPYKLNLRHSYEVATSAPLNERRHQAFEYDLLSSNQYLFYATPTEIDSLRRNKVVTKIKSSVYDEGFPERTYAPLAGPNRDNWGPVQIPRKGDRITVTEDNYKLLEKIFTEYEAGDIPEIGSQYTIQNNYYFVLGDNRHNALDSRYLGFIPEYNVKGHLLKE